MELLREPFEHVIIDDFLPEESFEELCEALLEVETEYKRSDLFSFEQSQDLSDSSTPAISSFRERLLGLCDALKEVFGVETSAIDMFAAFYHDYDRLLPHDDRLEGRKIAYTFYLAAPARGGALALLDDEAPYDRTRVSVVPNRLVLFKVSERSWHEVEEVEGSLPRISLSGWFS